MGKTLDLPSPLSPFLLCGRIFFERTQQFTLISSPIVFDFRGQSICRMNILGSTLKATAPQYRKCHNFTIEPVFTLAFYWADKQSKNPFIAPGTRTFASNLELSAIWLSFLRFRHRLKWELQPIAVDETLAHLIPWSIVLTL